MSLYRIARVLTIAAAALPLTGCYLMQAAGGQMAIIIIEQFAHDVLAVATRAGVMIHGTLVSVGRPDEIAATVSDSYLASTAG